MMTVTETNKAGRMGNEAALFAAVQGGSMSSFETLIKRYEGRIYRLAKTITDNEIDAEEVTQEAFFQTFEHIEDFRGESRFYAGLLQIAVDEALMKLRNRRPEPSLDALTDNEVGPMPREIEHWGPAPEKRYSQSELAEILSGVISELPARLRIVFQLRDVEKLSTEETANLLEISVSAVKFRLLRARLVLRERLNRFMRNEPGPQLYCSPTFRITDRHGLVRQVRSQGISVK